MAHPAPMPGTGHLRSSSSTAGPSPPLTVPLRNGTRGRIIEILAHTANGCLNELGYSPGMIEREQALLGENAQLKQHNAVLAERLDQYVDENRKLYEDNSRLILQAGSANKERIVAKNESGRLREELKQFREFEGQDKVEVVQQYARLVRDHQAVLGQYHSLVDDLQRRGILSANPANPNPNGPQVAPTLPPSHQQHQQAQPQHWQGPQQNARPVQQQQQPLFASQQQQHPPVHIPAQPNANSHGPVRRSHSAGMPYVPRGEPTYPSPLGQQHHVQGIPPPPQRPLAGPSQHQQFSARMQPVPSPLSTQIPPPPSMLQQQQYASMPSSSSSMPQSQQSHLHQQHHRSPTMPMPPNMHSQHPQHPQHPQQQQRRRSDGQMIHAAQQYQQQQAGLQSMLLTQNGRPVQAQAPGQSPTGQQHAHSPSQSSPLSGFLSVFPPHEQQQQQAQRMDQPQPQVRTQSQLQAPLVQPSVLLSQGAPVYSRSPPPLPIASSSSSSNQIPPHHPVTMIPERTNSLPSSLPISRHPQQQQRPQSQHLPTPPNSGPTPPLPLPPAQSLHTISPNSLAGAFGMHAMVPQRVSSQMPPQPQQASELVLNIANFPSHNDAVSGGMPLQGPQPQGPPPMASLQRPMPEPMPHVSASPVPVMTTPVEVITVTPSSQQVDCSVRDSDGMASTSPIVVPNEPGTESNRVEESPASRLHVTVHAPVSDAGPSRPPSTKVDHVPDSSSLLPPPPQQLEPEPDADADVPMPGPEDTPSPAQDSGTSSSSEGHEAITPPPQPPMQPSLKRPSTERDEIDQDDDPRKRPRVEDAGAADTDGVQVKREMLDEAEGMGTDTEQVMPQAATAATQNETLKAEPMTEEEKDRRMAEAEAAADNEFVEVGPDGKRTKEDCVEQMFDADLVCMFCRRRALAVHEPVPPSWADKTIEQRIEHCETEHEPVWEILRNMVGEEDDEEGAGSESGEDH